MAQELDEAGDRDQRQFLQRELPDVAEAGDRVAQHLRRDDAAEHQHGVHADGVRGLELAARERRVGAAEDLGLVGRRDDADGERADREGRHADEAARAAEELADAAQGRAAAEIEQVDDEKVGDAAQTVV